jgi:hypothetical protein
LFNLNLKPAMGQEKWFRVIEQDLHGVFELARFLSQAVAPDSKILLKLLAVDYREKAIKPRITDAGEHRAITRIVEGLERHPRILAGEAPEKKKKVFGDAGLRGRNILLACVARSPAS